MCDFSPRASSAMEAMQVFFGGGDLDPSSVLGLFVMQNSDSGAFLAQKMGNCNSEKILPANDCIIMSDTQRSQSKPTAMGAMKRRAEN